MTYRTRKWKQHSLSPVLPSPKYPSPSELALPPISETPLPPSTLLYSNPSLIWWLALYQTGLGPKLVSPPLSVASASAGPLYTPPLLILAQSPPPSFWCWRFWDITLITLLSLQKLFASFCSHPGT